MSIASAPIPTAGSTVADTVAWDESSDDHEPVEATPLPKQIGQFPILGLLGEGGMGRIYAGIDPNLNRQVAIKVMRPETASKPEARQRFLREARAAAAVEHEALVPIYHVGEYEGIPYLVMPLLQGQSLDQLLSMVRILPIEWTLRLGVHVAQGLAAAHAAGLIHRDIKPANIWIELTPSGNQPQTLRRARILDFGLARSVQASDALTGSGVIIGTPSYMAPEQAAGGAMDARVDLYSLGLVLYRCLTGVNPFELGEVYATLTAIATRTAPPLIPQNPQITPALQTMVLQLLEKDPHRRIPRAELVAMLLDALLRGVANPFATTGMLTPPTTPFPMAELASGPVRAVTPTHIPMPAPRPIPPNPQPVVNSPFAAIDVDADADSEAAGPTVTSRSGTKSLPKSPTGIPWLWIGAGGGVVCAAVLGLLWMLGVGKVKSTDGMVSLRTTVSGVVVRFFRENQAIADADHATPANLPAGTYHAELIAPLDQQLRIDPANFVLRPNERLTMVVSAPSKTRDKSELPSGNPKVDRLDKLLFDDWLMQVRGLNGEDLADAIRRRLRQTNSGQDGEIQFQLDATTNAIIGADAAWGRIPNLAPLQTLTELRMLVHRADGNALSVAVDFSPLQQAKLEVLDFNHAPIQSLEFLRGMPIKKVNISNTRVQDLSPLEQSPLDEINIYASQVQDLTPLGKCKSLKRFTFGGESIPEMGRVSLEPLRGLSLEYFSMNESTLTDLSPLEGMPLREVGFITSRVRDITPVCNPKLRMLRCRSAPVQSLEPLKGIPLEILESDLAAVSKPFLREIPTLREINRQPAEEFLR
ncbi:serine/threonine-protein kinase [Tuwongella immobilis]|uniref:serine/threonine-protein kinase n=1 Tax=Tuwongella immobilis TaxID=692036 RepID=UPI0018D681C3|nr:serine/threonine-protein kinase [Tuwongella immobilis]